MRFLLCFAVLATAAFGVFSYPTDTDLNESKVPRRGNDSNKPPKPKPNFPSKPNPSSESFNVAQSPSAYIANMAQASASAESPPEASAPVSHEVHSSPTQTFVEPPYDPILETASNYHIPEAVVQDALPEIEILAVEVPVVQLEAGPLPGIEQDVLSTDHVVSAAASAHEVGTSVETVSSDVDVDSIRKLKKSTKIANFVKLRRHAGVEFPTGLRIGDFEDVETDAELLPYALKVVPEYPSIHEQKELNQELSKEEMILMAMDQMHHNLPQVQLSRPGLKRPNGLANRPINLNSGFQTGKTKPQYQFDSTRDEEDEAEAGSEEESNENDGTVDLRNGEPPATIVQEQSAVPMREPSSSGSHFHTPYGSSSKNKPRPYGMDKPSKNRPTLDSGMKNEHHGVQHSSSSGEAYVQKGESSGDIGSTTYLGFQIPNIRWTSFSDLFPMLWGNRLKQTDDMSKGMGKSDQTIEQIEDICVDDEEVNEGARSPIIQSSALCTSSETPNNCNQACQSNGFASGSCLGPYPTPGCLCRMPKSKEFGLLLDALEPQNSSASHVDNQEKQKDMVTSDSAPCKKCACLDACKKSGSYTGFCVDRCYCAVPWYSTHV